MNLVLLFLLPFVGGFLSWQTERFSIRAPRWVALITMLTVLALTVHLWLTGDYSGTWLGNSHRWAFDYRADWIPRFGISFHFALDGLSLLLVALTGLLGVMAVACSWREVSRHVGFFHLNLLWNLGGVIGVFMAMDLFLFFFFWEMMLVPMFFLIALWGHNIPGGKDRVYAATKFFIFTQASGLLMLLSILALVFVHYRASGRLSFDYQDLLGTPMSAAVEFWIMLGFFVAFMVKLPVLPLHSWLPDAHSQAPTAGSVDLAGVLLKTAAYGFLRFCLPLFPHASAQFAPVAMWLGVAGIIYGALLAFAQTDIKRLVAYTSISHMGFVLIGIYAGTEQALQGAVLNMLAHGISAGALFILSGEIYERLHTRDLRQMSGLWARFAFLPPILLFFAVASLGLPGLGNFVGEFLILVGTFKVAPVVTWVAASGLVLAAAYALILVQRSLHGPPLDPEHRLVDLNKRELATMLTLMALLLWLGVYPQTFLDTSSASMSALHHWYAEAQLTNGIAAR
ncbi:MAG: NADH-quinone oxidoreductase subunit M [Gammaproteobacteria bacterium]|nr:NADH-quinone oxidoreductase subunit M [Gammaproteobacteria bacterium]